MDSIKDRLPLSITTDRLVQLGEDTDKSGTLAGQPVMRMQLDFSP